MLDPLRRDIQARLEDLLDEIERLRRALAALTSREGESARGDRAAPASGSAGQSVTRTVPPRPPVPVRSAAVPTRARTAPGATKTAVLGALGSGNAMTAGEIAAATGLGRASVSTTLSKLASSGEIAKVARGYQLARESDSTRKPARPRPSVSPSPQPAEPEAAKPEAAEPSAIEPEAAEPLVAEPEAAEPLVVEPPVAQPEAGEPPAAEPPTAAPSTAEPASSAARPAPGATKHAVLAALVDAGAMTAGEVAAATGLGRASVSSTLSALVKVGELRKAGRGYQLASVEPAQRFYFRIVDDATPRVVVANLPELEAVIAICSLDVVRHHCAEHDFSRWVAGVFENEPLAADIAAAEAQLSGDSPTETVEHSRLALIAVLQARHATQR